MIGHRIILKEDYHGDPGGKTGCVLKSIREYRRGIVGFKRL